MRNFEEEIQKQSSPKQPPPQLAIFKALGIHHKHAYPALLGVLVVLLIAVMLLLVAFTSGNYQSDTSRIPKVVVVLAPGLSAQVLESAMLSNKAPNTFMLASNGGVYGRVNANVTDSTAALVTLLTGTAVTYHNVTSAAALPVFYGPVPSIMRYAKTASLLATSIASTSYYSSGTYSSSGTCTNIGVLDAECIGAACPASDSGLYCSSVTRVKVASGDAALMGTLIGDQVNRNTPSRDATVIIVDAFDAIRTDDENSLHALSNVALFDGVVGQIAVDLQRRSYSSTENWLLIVAGDGVGTTTQQAPLLVASYALGIQTSLRPINSMQGNIADVFPTVFAFLGIPVPTSVVGKVQGVCGAGSVTRQC